MKFGLGFLVGLLLGSLVGFITSVFVVNYSVQIAIARAEGKFEAVAALAPNVMEKLLDPNKEVPNGK